MIRFIILLIILVISSKSIANTGLKATDEACLAASKKLNAALPSRQDSFTTVIGTSCRREGDRIVFVYENQIDIKNSAFSKTFEKEQRVAVKNMVCSNPAFKPLVQFADLRYDYYDASRIFVGTAIVKVEDCPWHVESAQSDSVTKTTVLPKGNDITLFATQAPDEVAPNVKRVLFVWFLILIESLVGIILFWCIIYFIFKRRKNKVYSQIMILSHLFVAALITTLFFHSGGVLSDGDNDNRTILQFFLSVLSCALLRPKSTPTNNAT